MRNEIKDTVVWIFRCAFVVVIAALITSAITQLWLDFRLAVYINADKLGHFASMFLLSVVAVIAFPSIRVRWILLAVVFLGAAIELMQIFNSRSADLIDFLASAAGVATVGAVYFARDLRQLFAD